jgi:hypothetical protein
MVAYGMDGLRDFVPNIDLAARAKKRPLRGGAFDCMDQSVADAYEWQLVGR